MALRKVFTFATERIFEVKISGKMVAVICQGLAKVNAKETLRLFIPYLCNTIETLIRENPDVLKEEHLDDGFLYNLLLLSEVRWWFLNDSKCLRRDLCCISYAIIFDVVYYVTFYTNHLCV